MLFKQETHRASQNRCHHTKAHNMMITLGLENCKRAMDIAEREFKIPQVLILFQLLNRHIVPTFKPKPVTKTEQVLEPEHFASPHLDELSGMTYLSYFMKVTTISMTMMLTPNLNLRRRTALATTRPSTG